MHLPLIVPPGCGFRVGSETREWVPGKAWVFDDTIEHEAWNLSDVPRGVLIFDIWNPFLTAGGARPGPRRHGDRRHVLRHIRAGSAVSPGERGSRSRAPPALLLGALALTAAPLAAGAAQPAAPAPQSSLQACASIAADADRLACYDRLAGRAVPSVPAHGATAVAPRRHRLHASRTARAAACCRRPPLYRRPRSLSGSMRPNTPSRPLWRPPLSLEARVVALGKSANGHMTVSLEGGAVWELDDSDPLLAVGETVTITRATFGSYLMHTPSKRTHRARRLS